MTRIVLAVVVLAAACGGQATRGTPQPAGEPAPAFSLTAHDGTTVSLADVIRDGPAVLVFYRGHW